MKGLKLLIRMSILAVFLYGCSQSIEGTDSPKATMVEKIETTTPKITNSPSKYNPSEEVSPTVTPSKSPTSFPTLSREQIDQELTNLLATNGNCTGPCFWGFTPNKTSYNQAVQELTKFRGRFDSDLGYFAGYSIVNMHIYFNLYVYGEENEPIESIRARIMGLESPFLKGEEWMPYKPDTILTKFGSPQKIQFIFASGPEGRAGYGMVFLYENMYIYYDSVSKVVSPSFVFPTCPAMPENIDQLDIFIGEYEQYNFGGDPISDDHMVDVEELTDMSIDVFSKILVDPNQGCFYLDYDKYLSLIGK